MPSPVTIDQNAKLEDKVIQYQQALDAAQAQIDALKRAAGESQSTLDALRAEASKNRQLAFLGIVSTAKSFVILVDMSKSMNDYEHLVRKTLGELLEQMDESYRVQIIGFQGHAQDRVLPKLTEWQPAGSLAPMNAGNIKSALNFGDHLLGNFDGGTPTYLALHTALKYDAEAIFILTDGEPTDIKDGQEIITRITKENTERKKIYTVAVGNYRKLPELVSFLEGLSQKNQGKFLGVSD